MNTNPTDSGVQLMEDNHEGPPIEVGERQFQVGDVVEWSRAFEYSTATPPFKIEAFREGGIIQLSDALYTAEQPRWLASKDELRLLCSESEHHKDTKPKRTLQELLSDALTYDNIQDEAAFKLNVTCKAIGEHEPDHEKAYVFTHAGTTYVAEFDVDSDMPKFREVL